MRTYLFTSIFLLCTSTTVLAQEEFQIHIQSIDSTFRRGHPIDRLDTVFNANKALVDYVLENQLLHPNDKRFISNRALLYKLKHTKCDTNYTEITDTLENGDTYHIYQKPKNIIQMSIRPPSIRNIITMWI